MFVLLALALSLAQLPGNQAVAPAASAQETAASAKLSSSELAQLQSKAEAGDAVAQLVLGRAYQDGNGLAQNDELAVKWYRKAAEQGNPTAQNNLGILYQSGRGVEKNKEEAVNWYRKAARQGHASAMFNLGAAYYNGEGVPLDDAKSYAWFVLAKQNGNPNAVEAVARAESELSPGKIANGLIDLGAMFEKGEEVPQDPNESARWFRAAAGKGDREAQLELALLLLKRRGPEDYAEARRLCEEEAKDYQGRGAYCLGLIYQHGLGVEKDVGRAVKLYRQSGGVGNTLAMYRLGEIYEKGEMGQVDRPEALLCFVFAASKGDQGALREVKKLRASMSKQESEKADKKLQKAQVDVKKLDAILQGISAP